jgi:hypothetical protein
MVSQCAAYFCFHFLAAVDIKVNFDAQYKGGMERQMKQTWRVTCDFVLQSNSNLKICPGAHPAAGPYPRRPEPRSLAACQL